MKIPIEFELQECPQIRLSNLFFAGVKTAVITGIAFIIDKNRVYRVN